MVSSLDGLRDVTLFMPTKSLVFQAAKWSERHPGFALRIVSSQLPGVVFRAFKGATFSILDATDQPQQALALLEGAVERFGRLGIAVYTEIMHEGMELIVRSAGIPLWLGPMSAREWSAALESMARAEVNARF